jgi:hypothetical protein
MSFPLTNGNAVTFDQHVMHFEANRLRSFKEWKFGSTNVAATPTILANAGNI